MCSAMNLVTVEFFFFANSTMTISNMQYAVHVFINKFAFKCISALLTHLLCKCVALFDTSVDWSAIFVLADDQKRHLVTLAMHTNCILFLAPNGVGKIMEYFPLFAQTRYLVPNIICNWFRHRFCDQIILKSHQRDRCHNQPPLNTNSQCQISILLHDNNQY